MVDLEQRQAARGLRRRLDLAIAGREGPRVVRPVDERMEDLAVGVDRGPAQDAILAAVELGRLEGRHRATGRRLAPGGRHVVDRERDVVDAVAVGPDVLGDLAVRGQRRREHEADVVLDHDVAGPVADLGLETAVGDRGEAPQRPVVRRRLAGVADPELDVVDALERQEVGSLGVGVRVDPGARLVGGALRDDLRHRGLPCWRGGSGAAGAPDAGRCVHATPHLRH